MELQIEHKVRKKCVVNTYDVTTNKHKLKKKTVFIH